MSVGYVQLLRESPDFRRLWLAELVSFLGDWFNTIALYAAVEQLSSSTQAVTAVFIAKLLPVFLMTPVAGPLIDRFDRRKLMVATDVARAVCALGLIVAYRAHSLVALIAILVVMVAFSGIFIPTRTAVIPQLTTLEQLGAANALSAGTWSVMLAFGAALGGVVTGLVGIEMSLVIDAVTFLGSAALLLPLPALSPHDHDAPTSKAAPDRSFMDGLRYLRRHPYLSVLIALKPCMAMGGAALAMLPVFATRVFEATAGPTYIGLLYASRGLGALVGSLLIRRVFGDAPATMRRFITPAFLVISASYLGLAAARNIWQAALAYFGSAVGGGTIWTFAGTLSQRESDNAYRGRVFSVEWGALTLSMSTAAGVAGVLVDRGGWTVQQVAQVSGSLLLAPALLWLLAQRLHRTSVHG